MPVRRTLTRRVLGSASMATAVVLAALVLVPEAESTSQSVTIEGDTLVVTGDTVGDHIVLGMSGDGRRFEVEGYLPGGLPRACSSGQGDRVVRCSAAGIAAAQVNSRGGGDLVEVADTLPVSLTIRLGGGQDKFIGAGERDFCFPGGARRNRCIGNGGNDVCITGPRNSDCVGGRGRDYCEHGTGSDGCWGGPGADVCRMGPGHDGCHGDAGNDRLYGGSSSDQLYGGRGNDFCDGGPGIGKSHNCERGPRH
jgi:Ca2+-binding RTX toxin-like protein